MKHEVPPLSLHVPEAHFRPGDTPDFGYLDLPAAGEAQRPPMDAKASETRELAFGLVRVLDDEGKAVGPWDPKLDAETLRKALRAMMLTRAFDEQMFKVQRQGKTSFYLKCTGEEAVAIGQVFALEPGDMCFPSYRQQGLLIGRGWPIFDMMCQIYSNALDRLKGRQLPVLYSAKEAGFFSLSGNLATQVPQAVGWAMASAYKHDRHIAAAWVGEGASAEGDFHHGLTFAAVYHAPVILNLVNNQWAISSSQGVAGGEEATFASRAIGFGIPGIRVDGNDLLAVYAVTRWAAERARSNHGPTLIELFTYRVAPHSTSDDPSRYRPGNEEKFWPLGDPIERLKQHLIGLGEWSEERHAEQATALQEEVRAANGQAQSHGILSDGPHHEAGTMFEDVFKEMPWHLREQQAELERFNARAEEEGA
ncbi:3-methyl-2-oxobutanoate dehydrogenase (2-methylpropanoyl-transferring) subunit alpha [Labrys okinawensis]|uniref:3-methyl-2-oxobutanoate dehydrogenase (2-methylpropanoyl-transferring) subunit alpha n=1 Tax=Labrys okinawensis TaxID=346911 RepID=UPI0039BD3108